MNRPRKKQEKTPNTEKQPCFSTVLYTLELADVFAEKKNTDEESKSSMAS